MKQFFGSLCLGLMILNSAAAQSETLIAGDQLARQITKAENAFSQKKFEEAITAVEPVIASFEKAYPLNGKLVYCSESQAQTLSLLLMASTQKKDAMVVEQAYCDAYFMKGFALIDLKRLSDAEPSLKKASDLAPLNAHFMNEYAEWQKANRNWQQSYDTFEKAKGVAEFTDVGFRKEVEARSLRGMGFNLIEMGKLKEAEMLFKQSLKVLPNNAGALSELQYIKEQMAKKGK